MNNKRVRRTEISALNVLFSMIVIFIHLVSYPMMELSVKTVSYNIVLTSWRLASFVVQGFIMLSGIKLFLNEKDKMPYGKYILARLKGVVLPYVVCFVIYYIYHMVAKGYNFDVKFFFGSLFGGGLTYHFYFIVVLIQFDLLLPLWKRIIPKYSPLAIIPFAMAFMFLMDGFQYLLITLFPGHTFVPNDRLFTSYLLYWIVGCYIGIYYDEFKEFLLKHLGVFWILCGFSTVLTLGLSFILYNNYAWVSGENIAHGMYVLSMCMGLYGISLKVSQKLYEKVELMTWLDKSSFYIYLYHVIILYVADSVLELWGVPSQIVRFVVRGVLVYTLTPVLGIGYIKIKEVCLSYKAQLRTKAQER